MINRKYLYTFWLACLVVLGILVFQYFNFEDQKLFVSFLDVGQGDAILISQGDKRILVDGGPSETKLAEKLGANIPFWDRQIDLIILTHPDQDHLAGLFSVIKRYQVGAIIESSVEHDSVLAKNFDQEVEKKNIPVIQAEASMIISWGKRVELKILHPASSMKFGAKESNAGSVVTQVRFGENSFLLTGDLPLAEEKLLVANNPEIKTQILKVSHHGSRYGSSDEFLSAIQGRTAIISVGADNAYGHPNPEALERLKKHQMEILQTKDLGDIIFVCPSFFEACYKK